MDRTINYQITEEADGLRIEQFLRHQGYSYQNITQLKKMPESILKNGEWSYMQTTLQAGDIEGYITEGKLTVSAASVDTMEEFVTAKDTVIVANREDAQIGAIQTGVQCVVVCMGTEVTDKVLELAKEKNCRIITTPYDTFTASRLICQAMPVSYICLLYTSPSPRDQA